MPLTTLARWLRRLADRIDPPRPRDPFAGQPSPIYLPPPQRLGIPPERVISPDGALLRATHALAPVDPEYVFTACGLEPYRRPDSGEI